jgi:hypothetical protein
MDPKKPVTDVGYPADSSRIAFGPQFEKASNKLIEASSSRKQRWMR